MSLKNVKTDEYLYHITDINHLESIIKNGLCSRHTLLKLGIEFNNIADREIIYKRGNLDHYVPFHFNPYTSFDYSVRNNNPDKTFIYLCIERNFAKNTNFKILTQHPLANNNYIDNNLYDYEEGIKRIDFNIMSKRKEEIKAENIDKNIAKQIKMSECLAPKKIMFDDISLIIVKDIQIREYVEKIL